MHRMDKQLKWMSMNEATGMVRPEDVASRETELLASYQPLGEIFCDLHDRPERMLAKGVIRDIVAWKDCRTYFYWRLKRKFEELRITDALTASGKAASYPEAIKLVENAVPAGGADKTSFEALSKLSAASL